MGTHSTFRFSHLIIILLLYTISNGLFAESDREIDIKSAFILHFCKLIEFPIGDFTEFKIGIIGSAKYLRVFKEFEASRKQVHDKYISVFYTKDGTDLPEAQLYFVDGEYNELIKSIINRTRNKPTIIVTDSPSYTQVGAIISFLPRDANTFGFSINHEAAKRKLIMAPTWV